MEEYKSAGVRGFVDPDNHTGKIVWAQTATTHSGTYECCGAVAAAEEAHTFKWVTDREATETEAGSKHEEGTVCGYAKSTVAIPALEAPTAGTPTDNTTPAGGGQTVNKSAPKTGDDNNPALWITLMLTAGTALAGTILYSRKKKDY